MYENKFPEVDDLVMVRVKSIDEMGAYVSLLEYNNIEGMILLSELSRRRIRSIGKLLRVGRQETVVVLRVDKEKGYIDLSKRRVSPEEIVQCDEKFTKSKTVHSIMRHIAEIMHQNLEELYVKFGWPLYKKYGHAFDGFKKAITHPDEIFEGIDFTPDLKDAFIKIIQRRLAPQPTKIRADLEVTCFHYEGIDAIKEALTAGQKVGRTTTGTSDPNAENTEAVTIKLVAPPLYVMVTTSLEKEKGILLLNTAIEAVRKILQEKRGEVVVKVAPRAVSERDERELSNYMEEQERLNTEVSGDDDNEENEDNEDAEEGELSNNKDEEGEEEEEEEEEEKPKGKQAKQSKAKLAAKPAAKPGKKGK